MRRFLILLIAGLFLISVLAGPAYCGWKENYRTKYSKKTLDPDSERAKQIRRLGNMDFKFFKKRTPEEREALGIEPKTSLSASLMPWRREGESKDKFEGYTQNFSSAEKELPQEEKRPKTGETLTGFLQTVGDEVAKDMDEALIKE